MRNQPHWCGEIGRPGEAGRARRRSPIRGHGCGERTIPRSPARGLDWTIRAPMRRFERGFRRTHPVLTTWIGCAGPMGFAVRFAEVGRRGGWRMADGSAASVEAACRLPRAYSSTALGRPWRSGSPRHGCWSARSKKSRRSGSSARWGSALSRRRGRCCTGIAPQWCAPAHRDGAPRPRAPARGCRGR